MRITAPSHLVDNEGGKVRGGGRGESRMGEKHGLFIPRTVSSVRVTREQAK